MVERWRVLRLDDNDQRYLVTECSSEAEAQRIAAEYTAKGHKQCYWVEAVMDPSAPPDAFGRVDEA